MEHYEDLGNGWTKAGEIAGDYRDAGADPNKPRLRPSEVEDRISKVAKERDDAAQ